MNGKMNQKFKKIPEFEGHKSRGSKGICLFKNENGYVNGEWTYEGIERTEWSYAHMGRKMICQSGPGI